MLIYQTEEREALRKQGLNEKTAASVLLKLFISGNEKVQGHHDKMARTQTKLCSPWPGKNPRYASVWAPAGKSTYEPGSENIALNSFVYFAYKTLLV